MRKHVILRLFALFVVSLVPKIEICIVTELTKFKEVNYCAMSYRGAQLFNEKTSFSRSTSSESVRKYTNALLILIAPKPIPTVPIDLPMHSSQQ